MNQKIYLERYRVCLGDNGASLKLAAGDGAVSYMAEDTIVAREVIVQVVPLAGLRLATREKLETEAVAAKQINHPNIPALCDFGFVEDELIYVTEYSDGTSAQAWLREHGPMPIGAVLRIASQMVGALSAAAFHGIFHRALHPENVLLVPGQTPEGEWPLIKIVNFFGVAPSLLASDTAGLRLDPASFASPEQLQEGAVDFRSEVYSLGCSLWFLLTGAAPLAGPETVAKASGVPAPVRNLIAQMVHINPSERQLDPLALQEQIQDCIALVESRDVVAGKFGLAPAVAAPVATPIPLSPRRPIPWKPLAIAAALLATVALAALVVPRSFGRGGLFSRSAAPIGVPVGISETSAAVATPENSTVTAAINPPVQSSESQPALVSTATADEAADASDSNEVANASATTPTAQTIAANTAPTRQESEPQPPSEGLGETSMPPASAPEAAVPAETTGNLSAPTSERARPVPSSSPGIAARDAEDRANSSSPRAKAADVTKTNKRVVRSARYAESNGMPPLPAHAVRVQYLGTTREGELVFGLPSSEKGFASPNGRRRARRIVKDPISELPVLPALPPDE